MKLKPFVLCAATLLAATSGLAFATNTTTTYFPPERIVCSMDTAKQLHCDEINHDILTEDSTTAELTTRDHTFNFVSGVAFFTPSMKETAIFFTYKNANMKKVRLKTTKTSTRPDLDQGQWIRIQDDLYVCDAGYMSCPITDA